MLRDAKEGIDFLNIPRVCLVSLVLLPVGRNRSGVMMSSIDTYRCPSNSRGNDRQAVHLRFLL